MLQKYSKPAGGAAICVLRPLPPLLVLVLRCWLKYCLENIHFCCCSVCEKAAFFRSGYSIFFRRAGRVCVISTHSRSSLAEILSSPKKYLPCWSSLQQQQCRVCVGPRDQQLTLPSFFVTTTYCAASVVLGKKRERSILKLYVCEVYSNKMESMDSVSFFSLLYFVRLFFRGN